MRACECTAHRARTRGARRATSHVPKFQMAGDVPKRAETLGTRSTSKPVLTSGRLNSHASLRRRPGPKSMERRSVMGGSTKRLPFLYATVGSPARRKVVSRMVGPAPPVPAV